MFDTNNQSIGVIDQQEGVLLQSDAIALDLTDDDVARAVGNRVANSKSWWNGEMQLEQVQKQAEGIWLGLSSADVDLYDYQDPYSENRIFQNIETLVSQAVGQPPQPMVTQAFDTDASYELARNYEKVLLARYRDLYLHAKMQMVARHLLSGFRYAVWKYRWDTSIGRLKRDGTRTGGIAIDAVRPDKIVFDAGATDKDNIPLIAEYMQDSWENLIWMYPSKSNEIMQVCGVSKGTQSPMTDLTQYAEVHFTGHHPTSGESYEGVTHKLQQVVLDKMKNPNYNYDEFKTNDKGELEYLNFFDRPKKPYIIVNWLNQGKYIVDSTSLVSQVRDLQRQLEKRGRQIDLNADSANAGTIYNTTMITEENMSKLIGDPNEKIGAKGDVREAASRLPINTLEEYVIEDKQDMRAQIDTIMGANAPMLGEKSGNPTLGQDELSVQRNSSRLGTLVTALENGADGLYKAITQLDKVFMTEPDWVKYTGQTGKTEFIQFSNMNIESGIGLSIRAGTIMPDDPATKAQKAKEFAPIYDPLTFAEESGLDDPKDKAERMFLLKSNPVAYGEKYLGIKPEGNHDPDAVNAIQQASQGKVPQVPASPSQNYVNQLNTHIQSPGFKQMSPVAQKILTDHATNVVAKTKEKLGVPQPQPKKQGFLSKILQGAKNGVKKTLFS
jgi:hypothetical protein